MYYPFFLVYILTGLLIGLIVFVWALKNDQFSDQQRARFLALEEDNQALAPGNGKGNYEVYAVLFLIIAGIISSAAIILYALLSI
jgi:cbb3-type cytochrome oxidase maturation protein